MIESSVHVSSKLPKVGATIFSTMSALAKENNAINLSQGFPEFGPDQKLLSYYKEALDGPFQQYAPRNGAEQLLEEISNYHHKQFGVKYSSDSEILITAGATQAIFTTISALLKEGDEAIIFTPAYDCYEPAIELVGGKVNYIKLKADDGFKIDWEEVKKTIKRKTKLIVLNSPHNPTGAIISQEDVDQLKKLVENSDIMILSDEVYANIVFDGQSHISLSQDEELRSRSIIVSSFGKNLHCTGWKMGYALAPKELMNEILKVHQYNVFSVNHPAQIAIANYMSQVGFEDLTARFESKRNLFLNNLDSDKYKISAAQGTYFQLLDMSKFMKDGEDDVAFAKRLTIENHIAAIPVSVFYHNAPETKFLRFCFAKEEETILRSCEALNNL